MKPHDSIRVFKNPYLERLTHVHPLTPLILWAPVISWLIWRAFAVHELSPYAVGTLAFSGLILWSLTEYLLHRFIFHFPAVGYFQERLQFLMHGLHHEDPVDPTRLVMPPAGAVILAVIFFTLFRFIMGQVYAESFFAFFVVGYLFYDYIHFYVHHFTPKTRLGKFLKHSHMIHHYVAPNARWGVSSPLWDYIFGTMEATESVEHGS